MRTELSICLRGYVGRAARLGRDPALTLLTVGLLGA